MSMTDDPRVRPIPAPEDQQAPAAPEDQAPEDQAEEEQQPDTEVQTEVPAVPPPIKPEQDLSQEARQRARYRQRLESLEAENKELRSRISTQVTDIKAEVDRRAGAPPKEADYRGDFLEYDRDVTVHKMRRAIIEDQVRQEAQRDQHFQFERMREAAEKHIDRVEEFKQRAPDFDEVLRRADDELVRTGIKEVNPSLRELMLQSDHSAQIAYYFGQNPQYFAQVNYMTPLQQARAIGALEAQINSVPTQKTRQQTRAPAPYRPLVGGAAPNSQDRELDAYMARKYGKRS